MKMKENLLVQGLILALTTQLVLSLSIDKNSQSAGSTSNGEGLVGKLYRSAAIKADPEKDTSLTQSGRGARCIRCGSSGYYGGNNGYADRDRSGYGYYGREDPYYAPRDNYYGRDRNWYYQPEYRNNYDRNYNRNYYYDDRYYGREDPQYYNDPRNNAIPNSYRGNGYDNTNPMYYEAMREKFNRDRGYGYDQYYDRFYDRPGYRSGGGYYDNRNFRPYDETYRGTAGFDNSGRGYYFASQHGQRPAPIDRQPYPDPYDQAHRPQPTQLNHYNPPQSQSHPQHTTPRAPPEFYNGKPAQTAHIQTVSSGTIGTVDNSTTNNKNSSNKEIDDKEKISSAYGRPSLGSSYLFDRASDDVNAGSGLSPPSVNDDKKQESANLEMKSE